MTARYTPHIVCDKIDYVSEPVAFIPASMNPSSYFRVNLELRSKEIFSVTPLGFIFRDDWDPSPNLQLNSFHEKVLTKYHLREYFNGSDSFKDEKYCDLTAILYNTGRKGTSLLDDEVIEEVKEYHR